MKQVIYVALVCLFIQQAAVAADEDGKETGKPKRRGSPFGIWAGENGEGCLRGVESLTHMRMLAVRAALAKLDAIDLGNGARAVNKYVPEEFRIAQAKADIKADMANLEERNVKFETAEKVSSVKLLMARTLENYPEAREILSGAMDELVKLEALQGVVFRAVTGGSAVGDTYMKAPNQIFLYVKLPNGMGERIEIFMEYGD